MKLKKKCWGSKILWHTHFKGKKYKDNFHQIKKNKQNLEMSEI